VSREADPLPQNAWEEEIVNSQVRNGEFGVRIRICATDEISELDLYDEGQDNKERFMKQMEEVIDDVESWRAAIDFSYIAPKLS
jgi:hypothetical protein